MDKKPLIGVSICAVVLLVLASLSNVVGMNTCNKTTVDDNEEIITFISGSYCNVRIHKRGFIRDVEIFAGSAGTLMEIHGWRYPPLQQFNELNIEYIHAYHFIGFFSGGIYGAVRGIAFGNIE